MDVVYPPVVAALRLAFAAFGLRVHVEGAERVPSVGPAVIASNHASYLDFAFLGVAARPSRRYVRFLARYDVWHHPVAGPPMRGMHHIPVDRSAPAGAYLLARSALRRGEVIGVFPEAGVSKSYVMRPLLPGAAALARDTGAPLVPVALWGGQRLFTAKAASRGHDLHLRRGRPITILVGQPSYVGPGADVSTATVELGWRLQELLDRAQRMHPDQPRPVADAPWHPAHLGGSAPTPEQARLIEDIPRHAIPLPLSRHIILVEPPNHLAAQQEGFDGSTAV